MVSEQVDRPVWMLLENDKSYRVLCSVLFKMWGKEPLVFEDGYQAWAWLDKVEAGEYLGGIPQIALMQIRVDGPQGYEVGQRMRSLQETRDTRLVILNAWRRTSKELDEVEKMEFDLFIALPLPMPDDLKRLLDTAVTGTLESRMYPEHLKLRDWQIVEYPPLTVNRDQRKNVPKAEWRPARSMKRITNKAKGGLVQPVKSLANPDNIVIVCLVALFLSILCGIVFDLGG